MNKFKYFITITFLIICAAGANATNLETKNQSSKTLNITIKGRDIFGNNTLDRSFTVQAGDTSGSDLVDIGYTNAADIWLKLGNGTLLKSAKITRDKNGFYTITDQQTGQNVCSSDLNAAPGKLVFYISDVSSNNDAVSIACFYSAA